MGVAVQAPLGVAVRGLVAGQVPDDERLVARAGKEHVGAGQESVWARAMALGEYALLERGRQRGDPAGMALEGATENELLGHDCREWLLLGDVGRRTRCGVLAEVRG